MQILDSIILYKYIDVTIHIDDNIRVLLKKQKDAEYTENLIANLQSTAINLALEENYDI